MREKERQGRLAIVGEAGVNAEGMRLVRVRCDCGTRKVLTYRNYHNNHVQSCGCLRKERQKAAVTTHGHQVGGESTPEYDAWQSMMDRCYREQTGSYPYYGGKGIGVCKEWRESFEAFLGDVGDKPSAGHVLCLLDKAKDFGPGNVAWLTVHDAGRKRRDNTFYTVNGVTRCLVDWAAEYKIPKNTLHYRVVTKGMNMRDALDVGRGRSGKLLPT